MNLIVLIFLSSVSVSQAFYEDDEYNKFMQTSISQGLQLFSGLDELLKYFRENETSPLAQSILETFEKECLFMEDIEVPEGRHRKPFIVIEGNHRPSRDVIAMRLAKSMGGRFLTHPAPCLTKYLDALPKGSLLRRAYYMLSLHAQAFNVKVHLSLSRTVIMNGYWLDQLVFHLLQSFPSGRLPPATSPIFHFPDDLLQPDVIYYLDIPDSLRLDSMTTRSPLNWKPRALRLYQELKTHHPIEFQTLTGTYRVTMDSIQQHIHDHLAQTRDIWPFKRPI